MSFRVNELFSPVTWRATPIPLQHLSDRSSIEREWQTADCADVGADGL